ncbi:MAG: hypothetical protein QOC55_126 [Thermoleophilaceae bacterium]|jgi:hypothetical protein|nr:hypothetical protein [Thermoleophilaceae bacterium]
MQGRMLAVFCAVVLAVPAAAAADVPVSVGSNPSPFPQNKQNEPAVAIDPLNTNIVLGGSNDEIDEPNCVGSSCPFVQGIGNTGVYWSTTGGSSWTQPNYHGYSARTGARGAQGPLGTGLIGTLPNYDTAGLVSDGDPAVAWGPAPGPNGFSWQNGERAYFANLTANFSSVRSDEAFKGYEAIAVSHTVDLNAAMNGQNSGWSNPSIVSDTRQSSSTFSDKEAVWADDAATSKYFGNVYVCWTDFRSATVTGNGNAPIMLSRSTDGGNSWSRGIQLTAAHNNASAGGRQGCDMRTDSTGVLDVFFTDSADKQEAIKLVRSTDGGQTIGKASVISYESNPGGPSVVRPGENDNIDGVAGSRTDDFPHVSIANGAPSGAGAPDTISVAWNDGGSGLGDEHVYVKLSPDGTTWTPAQAIERGSDRPAMPSVALSPDGKDLYAVYNAFLDPFREHVGPVSVGQDANSRLFETVALHGNVSGTTLTMDSGELFRGDRGDARASSANGLIDEFLGDYNQASATNNGAAMVYITANNAQQCQAIHDYRDSLVNAAEGSSTPPLPAPAPCNGTKYGNTDIRGLAPSDPSADGGASAGRAGKRG